MKVMDIQEKLDRGEYRVDAHAVAEAIVRRLLGDRAQPRVTSSSSPSA
jgi:anti-sigma28 factor (negative regulator of flagellin synthesis)